MSSHDDLAKMLGAGVMEPYLRHIRFPFYKNLEPGLRIEFQHPVTAIVGKNGTNKSSVLRALQGCRDFESPGRYWFGTKLDTIPDAQTPRIIHGWHCTSVNRTVEALKQRVPRRNDPDYWEPAESKVGDKMTPPADGEGVMNSPRKRDGERSADRWNPIDKEVVYLDFRSQLSAFDKFFYHNDVRLKSRHTSASELRTRRDRVRRTSGVLRRVFETSASTYVWNRTERITDPVRTLDAEALGYVSTILDREYTDVRIVGHRFFGVTGSTAVLETRERTYTEAFAGSGEFAVLALVEAVLEAPPCSLILLDEPEVSLHPGAQRRVTEFLVSESKRRRHQVVFATHSPAMIDGLPSNAVKVLSVGANGTVTLLSQAASALTAFHHLGQEFEKPTIVVEDPLAAEIVRRALRVDNEQMVTSFEVVPYAGGAAAIKSACLDWSAANSRVLVLLDGDQRTPSPLGSTKVPADKLEREVERIAGTKVVDRANGMRRGSADSEPDPLARLVDWWSARVRFLPGGDPEDWLIDQLGVVTSLSSKEYWAEVAREALGKSAEEEPTSAEILSYQKLQLVRLDDASLEPVIEVVREFMESGA